MLRRFIILPLVCLIAIVAPLTAAAVEVKGELTEVNGARVLRVWGTPKEQGFAQGYLFGEDVKRVFPQILVMMYSIVGATYEEYWLPKLQKMTIAPRFEEELRGMIEGIEAKVGGEVDLPGLGHKLRYEDLVLINCIGDVVRSGCSSFAAWGSMTEGGGTIAARNMDWPDMPPLIGTQIILVRMPAPGSKDLPYAAITWPTYIGVITGINAEGVMVAAHDADGHAPTLDKGFTPSGFIYRRVLESAHAKTARDDAARVIRESNAIVGSNMVITMPSIDGGPSAFVCEHDGDKNDGGGLTIRDPEPGESFFVCTNHFRKRSPPEDCSRYSTLTTRLKEIAADGKRVTVDDGWKLLESVIPEHLLTHHSVVFEPNKMLVHIAFAEPGKSGPKCKHATLDVAELLKRPDAAGAGLADPPPSDVDKTAEKEDRGE
jgi:hypothetical protein